MKATKKSYAGAAGFLERPADDGWPEDAGFWPIFGRYHPAPGNRRSIAQFIQAVMNSLLTQETKEIRR